MAKRTLIKNEEQAHSLVKHYLGHDFAWDFETTGLSYQHDRPLGLALTFDDERSYYICLEHSIEGEWEGEGRRPSEVYITVDRFRDIVAPLFNQRAPLMVAHNAKFDLHFMEKVGVEVLGRLADTMLAAKLIDENRSVGLKELAWLVGMDLSPYLELEHYQGFKKEEYLGVPLPIASSYAMLDTEATFALWKLFSVQMVEEGVDDVYQRVWIPMLLVLQQMEAKGIALDLEQVRRVREEYVQRASEAEWRIWQEGMEMVLQRYASPDSPSYYLRMATEDEMANVEVDEEGKEYIEVRGVRLPVILPTPRSKPRVPTFNASSSSQLNELLYEHKGLSPPEGWKLNKTANGGYSSDKNTLKIMDMALEDESPPILKDILELRKAEKFVGTYLDRFLSNSDPNDSDCIHTSFNQTVADTGRLSSSQPNVQNIPSRNEEGKQARAMFVARPGMSLVVCDYQAMEMRLAGHFAQDTTIMKAFADGMDLHVVMAAQNMGMPYEEVKALVDAEDFHTKQQRMIAKTQNFCVPLESLCLTRTGWKRYDEIEVGVDETVGYNPITGVSEWTRITNVNIFDDAELVKLSHQNWEIITTPNHRWWGDIRKRPYLGMQKYGKSFYEEGFIESQHVSWEQALHLAKPFRGGEGTSRASPQEAAIVAWLWTDGHIRRSPFVGAPSQGKYGHKCNFQGTIFQKKKKHFSYIEDFVLSGVPHTVQTRADGHRIWCLDPQFLRDLWGKLKLDEITPEQFVLSLSDDARAAFLESVERADGHGGGGRFVAQLTGIPEAIRLLAYFEGCRPIKTTDDRKIRFGKARVTGQRLSKTKMPTTAQVWCPTTELGTWTMKQGREICLTGNSLLYGMSPQKFRTYLRAEAGLNVEMDEAKRLVRAFDELYAGTTAWKEKVRRWVHKHGYVKTIYGRKRRLPEIWSNDRYEVMRAERQAVNAIIQGSCADIILEAIPAIQQALRPLGAYVLLQVHDEVVVETPTQHVDTTCRIVEHMMTTFVNPLLRVPLLASASSGKTWAEAK